MWQKEEDEGEFVRRTLGRMLATEIRLMAGRDVSVVVGGVVLVLFLMMLLLVVMLVVVVMRCDEQRLCLPACA